MIHLYFSPFGSILVGLWREYIIHPLSTDKMDTAGELKLIDKVMRKEEKGEIEQSYWLKLVVLVD